KVIGEQLFAFIGLDEYINAWNIIRWIVTSVTFFIALLLIYKLAPNEKVSFRHAITGALFATIFWQLTSLAFSFYVNTLGNYSATYGSLGTVIVLMIWFYLFGIIITTGGVINAFVKDWEEGKIVVLVLDIRKKCGNWNLIITPLMEYIRFSQVAARPPRAYSSLGVSPRSFLLGFSHILFARFKLTSFSTRKSEYPIFL